MHFLQICLFLYSTNSSEAPQMQQLFSTFFRRISFPLIKISKGVSTLILYLSLISIGIVTLPNSSIFLITPFHFTLLPWILNNIFYYSYNTSFLKHSQYFIGFCI